MASAASEGAPNPHHLRQIAPRRGSTPGGVFVDRDTGLRWYVKRHGNPERARNEALAAALYRAAGVRATLVHLVTLAGGPATASLLIPWLVPASLPSLATAPGVAEGFAVDAWLGNWDAAGPGNLMLSRGGQAVRIDPGGALRFRARGALKAAEHWGDVVGEVVTMRQRWTNPLGAVVFRRVDKAAFAEGVAAVLSVSPQAIAESVERLGPEDSAARTLLTHRLLARREYFEAWEQRGRVLG